MLGTSPIGRPKLTNPAGFCTWMSRRYGAVPGTFSRYSWPAPRYGWRRGTRPPHPLAARIDRATAGSVGEVGEFRASPGIDEIPRSGDHKIEAEPHVRGLPATDAVLDAGTLPRRRQVQVKIGKRHPRSIASVVAVEPPGGTGAPAASESRPAMPVIVIGARIHARRVIGSAASDGRRANRCTAAAPGSSAPRRHRRPTRRRR